MLFVLTCEHKGEVQKCHIKAKLMRGGAAFHAGFDLSSRRIPIVLRTFTSSSRKFVDLSYRALLFIEL